MYIQLWLDFSCPYCYIGKHNLDVALNQLSPEQRNQVRVIYRSFELEPHAPKINVLTSYERLAQKYQCSIEQARIIATKVTTMAKESGLMFDLDRHVPANSFKAHQLVQFAMTQQKESLLIESLFQAHFSWGLNINDESVLSQLAGGVGIDLVAGKDALNDEHYAKAVRLDQIRAQQIRIGSVPFFVFDERYAAQGVQPVDVLVNAIQDSLAKA